jgi:L-ascorbate metabolism protein UlaG (beta-lactamase superfamily)
MKIKWLGHASFLITSDSGVRIITDPYPDGVLAALMGLRYKKIQETADIVTISHDHPDHNNIAAILGNPKVIRESGTTEVKGISFKGITASHGRFRGSVVVFCFTIDGVRLCHPGDLVRLLTEQQISEAGEVDILFLPIIGLPLVGKFTFNAAKPDLICERLKPKVAIPMHFRNSRCWMPFPTIDRFLADKTEYQKLQSSEVEFSKESLPSSMQILVLEPAL